MKKDTKTIRKIAMVFILLFAISVVADFMKENEIKNGYLQREEIGEEKRELQLQLEIKDLLEDYDYTVELIPASPTKTEADVLFSQVIEKIADDFIEIKEKVPLKKEYLDGAVKAKWSFQPFGIIDSSGNIDRTQINEETIVEAQVELTCGDYKKIHIFSFVLPAVALTEEETILKEIDIWIEEQMTKEGSKEVELPKEINGKTLVWTEKKDYITPKILLLEIIAVVMLWYISKKKQKEEEKKRILEMEKEYPDIVNQFALLLGAGMTIRQAWNRIAAQYSYKKQNKMIKEKPVYEAILRMNRRFTEGESERAVYQQFYEEIPAPCYHKLMRILLGNLEKGTKGVLERLEKESQQAFEQKIQLAKKYGEEASTKMLVPLMFMMMMVMGIVMLPALMQFQI